MTRRTGETTSTTSSRIYSSDDRCTSRVTRCGGPHGFFEPSRAQMSMNGSGRSSVEADRTVAISAACRRSWPALASIRGALGGSCKEQKGQVWLKLALNRGARGRTRTSTRCGTTSRGIAPMALLAQSAVTSQGVDVEPANELDPGNNEFLQPGIVREEEVDTGIGCARQVNRVGG